MRGALTRRALDMLAQLAKDEPEKYRGFWKEFGRGAEGGRGRGSGQSRARCCRCCASPAPPAPATRRA